MSTDKKPVLLVPGWMHDYALAQITGAFEVIRTDSANISAVPRQAVSEIRGIASATAISGDFMDLLPSLEIIAHYGVGYDAVDTIHAAKKGIVVTNTPGVLTEEVADTTIGLLINTLRELPRAEAFLRAGEWLESGYPPTRLTLRGRSIGIYGMGRIGRAVARRLEAFGVGISYHNRRAVDGVNYQYHPTLISLAETVDTLISTAPGGTGTDGTINAEIFEALGSSGVLISVGRGSVVDEDALITALRTGTIAAAGLDVFAKEPSVPQALLDLPNVNLQPHVGSGSADTRKAMGGLVADNLLSWFHSGIALTPVPETPQPEQRKTLSKRNGG